MAPLAFKTAAPSRVQAAQRKAVAPVAASGAIAAMPCSAGVAAKLAPLVSARAALQTSPRHDTNGR